MRVHDSKAYRKMDVTSDRREEAREERLQTAKEG